MITIQSTIDEIRAEQLLLPVKNHLVFDGSGRYLAENGHLSLSELEKKTSTWNAKDMLYGLQSMAKASAEGRLRVHHFRENASVALVQISPLEMKSKRYFVLCSGGAYGAVCNLCEGFPVAARLGDLGYEVFCLNYTTASEESMIKGVVPAAMEDLAEALRFIDSDLELGSDYVLGGFSAGGHLVSLFGLASEGWEKRGCSRPAGLLLAYPLLSMASVPESPLKSFLCSGMFGRSYQPEDLKRYAALGNVDGCYPVTFMAWAKNDSTIPTGEFQLFMGELRKKQVKCTFEISETGGHGFGLGSATDIAGYVERAVTFLC